MRPPTALEFPMTFHGWIWIFSATAHYNIFSYFHCNFTFSLVQSILKHVIAAIPASGQKVLPMMAKVLAHRLVNGRDNGRSAVDFLAKLSSIIASELPGAREELQSLQWKDLPLIPDVNEILEPSKYKNSETQRSVQNAIWSIN